MSQEFRKRGPERLRPEDGSRVMSIKFRPKEYAKLKCLSLDTDKAIKALIFDAIRIAYGDTTEQEMNRIYGIPDSKPKIGPEATSVTLTSSWTYTTDTLGHSPRPAKSSTLPPTNQKSPTLKEVSDELWELLES